MNNYFSNVTTSEYFKEIKKKKIKDKILGLELKIKSKIPYPIKSQYNTVIPLNIYQTWHTKNLPILMQKTVNNIIKNNPAFNYQLFDDNDCREFIKNNFDKDVLNAFDSLVPGAYKADLWRYCILYKNGGIYLDIKYEPINNFKFINLIEKEHWVLDADKYCIYNALMVCKPNNIILLKAINKVVENVKKRFYGISALHPTGPMMLSSFFTNDERKSFDMYHDFYLTIDHRFIFFNNYVVFKSYNNYLNEHNNNKKVDYYGTLWSNNKIYK
jgi:mannosyltransferase OCH1-like enzyme